MRTGATLPELLVVLGVVALLASLSVAAVGGTTDRIAVRTAQHTLSQWVGAARRAARTSGGARLRVELDSARVVLLRSGRPDEIVSFGREFGVTIDSRGTRSPELRFDASGLGRFASRTFTLARGSATAAVVVSSYGRTVGR